MGILVVIQAWEWSISNSQISFFEFFQITVCGGDYTYINFYWFDGTNGFKYLLLQNPEKFCLQTRLHASDFI